MRKTLQKGQQGFHSGGYPPSIHPPKSNPTNAGSAAPIASIGGQQQQRQQQSFGLGGGPTAAAPAQSFSFGGLPTSPLSGAMGSQQQHQQYGGHSGSSPSSNATNSAQQQQHGDLTVYKVKRHRTAPLLGGGEGKSPRSTTPTGAVPTRFSPATTMMTLLAYAQQQQFHQQQQQSSSSAMSSSPAMLSSAHYAAMASRSANAALFDAYRVAKFNETAAVVHEEAMAAHQRQVEGIMRRHDEALRKGGISVGGGGGAGSSGSGALDPMCHAGTGTNGFPPSALPPPPMPPLAPQYLLQPAVHSCAFTLLGLKQVCPTCLFAQTGHDAAPDAALLDFAMAMKLLSSLGATGVSQLIDSFYIFSACDRPALHCSGQSFFSLDRADSLQGCSQLLKAMRAACLAGDTSDPTGTTASNPNASGGAKAKADGGVDDAEDEFMPIFGFPPPQGNSVPPAMGTSSNHPYSGQQQQYQPPYGNGGRPQQVPLAHQHQQQHQFHNQGFQQSPLAGGGGNGNGSGVAGSHISQQQQGGSGAVGGAPTPASLLASAQSITAEDFTTFVAEEGGGISGPTDLVACVSLAPHLTEEILMTYLGGLEKRMASSLAASGSGISSSSSPSAASLPPADQLDPRHMLYSQITVYAILLQLSSVTTRMMQGGGMLNCLLKTVATFPTIDALKAQIVAYDARNGATADGEREGASNANKKAASTATANAESSGGEGLFSAQDVRLLEVAETYHGSISQNVIKLLHSVSPDDQLRLFSRHKLDDERLVASGPEHDLWRSVAFYLHRKRRHEVVKLLSQRSLSYVTEVIVPLLLNVAAPHPSVLAIAAANGGHLPKDLPSPQPSPYARNIPSSEVHAVLTDIAQSLLERIEGIDRSCAVSSRLTEHDVFVLVRAGSVLSILCGYGGGGSGQSGRSRRSNTGGGGSSFDDDPGSYDSVITRNQQKEFLERLREINMGVPKSFYDLAKMCEKVVELAFEAPSIMMRWLLKHLHEWYAAALRKLEAYQRQQQDEIDLYELRRLGIAHPATAASFSEKLSTGVVPDPMLSTTDHAHQHNHNHHDSSSSDSSSYTSINEEVLMGAPLCSSDTVRADATLRTVIGMHRHTPTTTTASDTPTMDSNDSSAATTPPSPPPPPPTTPPPPQQPQSESFAALAAVAAKGLTVWWANATPLPNYMTAEELEAAAAEGGASSSAPSSSSPSHRLPKLIESPLPRKLLVEFSERLEDIADNGGSCEAFTAAAPAFRSIVKGITVVSSHEEIRQTALLFAMLESTDQLKALIHKELNQNVMMPSASIAILHDLVRRCPPNSQSYQILMSALTDLLVPPSASRSRWDDYVVMRQLVRSEYGRGRLDEGAHRALLRWTSTNATRSIFFSLVSVRMVILGLLFAGYYSGNSLEGGLVRRRLKRKFKKMFDAAVAEEQLKQKASLVSQHATTTVVAAADGSSPATAGAVVTDPAAASAASPLLAKSLPSDMLPLAAGETVFATVEAGKKLTAFATNAAAASFEAWLADAKSKAIAEGKTVDGGGNGWFGRKKGGVRLPSVYLASNGEGVCPFRTQITMPMYSPSPVDLIRDLAMSFRESLPSFWTGIFFLYPIYSPSVQRYLVRNVCDSAETVVVLKIAKGSPQLSGQAVETIRRYCGPKCCIVFVGDADIFEDVAGEEVRRAADAAASPSGTITQLVSVGEMSSLRVRCVFDTPAHVTVTHGTTPAEAAAPRTATVLPTVGALNSTLTHDERTPATTPPVTVGNQQRYVPICPTFFGIPIASITKDALRDHLATMSAYNDNVSSPSAPSPPASPSTLPYHQRDIRGSYLPLPSSRLLVDSVVGTIHSIGLDQSTDEGAALSRFGDGIVKLMTMKLDTPAIVLDSFRR